MLRVVIVDDEEMIIDELKYQLNDIDHVEVVAAYTQTSNLLEDLTKLNADIVFLDIEMPEITGIELAKQILKIDKNISIVFVTAYLEYAVDAYDLNATHYLLKPVRKEKLKEAVDRVIELKRKNNNFEIVNNEEKKLDKILIKNKDCVTFIKVKDIIFIETNQGGSDIVTRTERVFATTTIKYWNEQLKDLGFVHCHRSYIVNLDAIYKLSRISANYYELELLGTDTKIPVSRNIIAHIKRLLGVD